MMMKVVCPNAERGAVKPSSRPTISQRPTDKQFLHGQLSPADNQQ